MSYLQNLSGCNFSLRKVSNDTIFGILSSWCWLIGFQFGVGINNAESCMWWKPHKLGDVGV